MTKMIMLSIGRGEKRHQVKTMSRAAPKGADDIVSIAIGPGAMSKAEALDGIEKIRETILAGDWPIV